MDIRNYLFGGTTRTMVYRSMDAGAMRAKTIANNLANVMTPGYQRREVHFEDELRKAYDVKVNGSTTNNHHMEIGQEAFLNKVRPDSYLPNDPTQPGEINNVDIDLEASKMAENQILFNYATKFAGFGKYNAAITGKGSD